MDRMKYENCNKCRNEFGLLGGANVSHIKGNLVDLENDLRGQTRPNTRCPDKKYKPTNSKLGSDFLSFCNAKLALLKALLLSFEIKEKISLTKRFISEFKSL